MAGIGEDYLPSSSVFFKIAPWFTSISACNPLIYKGFAQLSGCLGPTLEEHNPGETPGIAIYMCAPAHVNLIGDQSLSVGIAVVTSLGSKTPVVVLVQIGSGSHYPQSPPSHSAGEPRFAVGVGLSFTPLD